MNGGCGCGCGWESGSGVETNQIIKLLNEIIIIMIVCLKHEPPTGGTKVYLVSFVIWFHF